MPLLFIQQCPIPPPWANFPLKTTPEEKKYRTIGRGQVASQQEVCVTLSVYQVVECFLLGQLREGSGGVACAVVEWRVGGGRDIQTLNKSRWNCR